MNVWVNEFRRGRGHYGDKKLFERETIPSSCGILRSHHTVPIWLYTLFLLLAIYLGAHTPTRVCSFRCLLAWSVVVNWLQSAEMLGNPQMMEQRLHYNTSETCKIEWRYHYLQEKKAEWQMIVFTKNRVGEAKSVHFH